MLIQVSQRNIYATLYRILSQRSEPKKTEYKAFNYEDDLKRELQQVKEKVN